MKIIQKLVMLVALMGFLHLGAAADDDNQNGDEKMVYSISDKLVIEQKLSNNKEELKNLDNGLNAARRYLSFIDEEISTPQVKNNEETRAKWVNIKEDRQKKYESSIHEYNQKAQALTAEISKDQKILKAYPITDADRNSITDADRNSINDTDRNLMVAWDNKYTIAGITALATALLLGYAYSGPSKNKAQSDDTTKDLAAVIGQLMIENPDATQEELVEFAVQLLGAQHDRAVIQVMVEQQLASI